MYKLSTEIFCILASKDDRFAIDLGYVRSVQEDRDSCRFDSIGLSVGPFGGLRWFRF